jgi:SAM-dependent methyltransferase
VAQEQAMTRSRIDHAEWRVYLTGFHARLPGITEEILGAARSQGSNPYEWLLEAVPSDTNLLDLACGSAPLLSAGWSGPWVGLDSSEVELDLAARHGDHRFVSADADNIPFDDGSFDAVACSMALMLFDPLHVCLLEASRVLASGGVMVVLLPGGLRPLTPGDLWQWTRLLFRLHRPRLTYPNERQLRRLDRTFAGTGLIIARDEWRRFAFPITDDAAGRRFIDSLYLPRVAESQIDAARQLAATWTGREIGIPLRRIVLRKRLPSLGN